MKLRYLVFIALFAPVVSVSAGDWSQWKGFSKYENSVKYRGRFHQDAQYQIQARVDELPDELKKPKDRWQTSWDYVLYRIRLINIKMR